MGYFQMFPLSCKLNKHCVPLHSLQVFNEKLLFQAHSHWLSFFIQITIDFEEEACVLKQNIKRKKENKYFCLITSALPLCPKLLAGPEHSSMGKMATFIIFLISDEWSKPESSLSAKFSH